MSTSIATTIVDPAERDEVPRCWTGEARGFAGSFSFSSATRPWNWMELDAEDADKLFALLSGFVAYFNARYADRPEQRIPPCWAEHGVLVEELTTLFGRAGTPSSRRTLPSAARSTGTATRSPPSTSG